MPQSGYGQAMSPVDGPSYDDLCVLQLSSEDCSASEHANLAVLTAVGALEMHTASSGAEDNDGRSAEFQHLDNKLNVLIRMFAGFWRQQMDLPPPVAVTVSAHGLNFALDGLDVPDSVKSLNLYLNDALPQALELPVASCETTDEGLCVIEFGELSDDLADGLSRHIFRRHRRALAQNRQALNLHSRQE